MKLISFFGLLLFFSCAHVGNIEKDILDGAKEEYAYGDMSGQYTLSWETKKANGNLVTRQTLFSYLQSDLPLEKTIAVSKIGSIKSKGIIRPSLRPEVSQHTIWFEKQKYFSQLKVDSKSRKLIVTMDSPEKKWQGTKSFDFPKGNIFCFYTQLPTCLKFHGILKKSNKERVIMLIWDSFPYHVEQLREVADIPFQRAKIDLDFEKNGDTKVNVSLGNQVIQYYFDRSEKFIKMFWIAQGISIKDTKEETEN